MHDSIVGIAYVPVPGSIGSTLYGVGYFSDDLYRIGNANDTTGASQAAGVVTSIVDLGVNVDIPASASTRPRPASSTWPRPSADRKCCFASIRRPARHRCSH